MRHKIIGFDAREMWLNVDSYWTQTRRAALLLRQDVVKPLSVDNFVWYSVFSEANYPHLWHSAERQSQYLGSQWNTVFSEERKLSTPDDFRPRRLWTNLATLQDYLQISWGNVWKPCCVVAVAEILGVDEEYETAYPILPNRVDSQWQLLGYDVADYELYTGLFNGVIGGNEATPLRATWQAHLNEHHLFREPNRAFEYIEVADKRHSSHSPYYVYALYGIQTYAVTSA